MAFGRNYANGVPLPLSATEIEAWVRMNGITLLPHEFRIIRHIDVAVLEGLRK